MRSGLPAYSSLATSNLSACDLVRRSRWIGSDHASLAADSAPVALRSIKMIERSVLMADARRERVSRSRRTFAFERILAIVNGQDQLTTLKRCQAHTSLKGSPSAHPARGSTHSLAKTLRERTEQECRHRRDRRSKRIGGADCVTRDELYARRPTFPVLPDLSKSTISGRFRSQTTDARRLRREMVGKHKVSQIQQMGLATNPSDSSTRCLCSPSCL